MARFADVADPELFEGREREELTADVRVVARRREGYTHDVEIDGGHRLVVDEPRGRRRHRHGALARPALLAASLAACTAITIEMYADRKGWELGAVEVEVDDRARPTAPTALRRSPLARPGARSSDEQRERLLVIAGKCPVHRALDRRDDGHDRTTGSSAA